MKKLALSIFSLAVIVAGSNVYGQGFKDKLKSKMGGGGADYSHLNEINDEYGVSGAYTSLDPEEVKAPSGMIKKINDFGFEFVKEKDGNVVNELTWHISKTDKVDLKLKESWKTKNNQVVFYKWLSASKYIELIQLEPGVFAGTTVKNSIPNNGGAAPADWERTVENVFAKDPAQLEVYDKETAKAKTDMIMMSLNAEAIEKKKKEMEGYEAYKNYVGKIAFSDVLNIFNYQYTDKPTEDPKKFKKELEIGKEMYLRAYLDKPLAIAYPGAWFNISYEMKGKKTDRESLRAKSSFYSKNIPRKDRYLGDFCTWVHSTIEKQRGFDVWDYAYVELLYQLKDEFKVGETYELTVTFSAFKDGENIATVAQGKVNLKFTEDSKKLLFNNETGSLGIINKYEKYLNE
ncbi:hypothetical protein K6119_12660 [Paracrocinitomix mangrovi]|uniref:hypothetical protein n=1 Tax=Paracrocinitomix mangrovi TaxID=2862509 RepID=UPI001C8D721F|nr:hypothetical protein [Paracrocinitomix mangrovi]UKN00582.1 hypothetical protein K6119_12660 [Paracrocinitomix mangrovi]